MVDPTPEPMNSSTMSRTFHLRDFNTPLPNIDEIITSAEMTEKKMTLPFAEKIQEWSRQDQSDKIISEGDSLPKHNKVGETLYF